MGGEMAQWRVGYGPIGGQVGVPSPQMGRWGGLGRVVCQMGACEGRERPRAKGGQTGPFEVSLPGPGRP
jgi:hypothetical protein